VNGPFTHGTTVPHAGLGKRPNRRPGRLTQGYPRPGIPSQPNLAGTTDKIGIREVQRDQSKRASFAVTSTSTTTSASTSAEASSAMTGQIGAKPAASTSAGSQVTIR
jgi:hypothetical protein